MKQKVIILTITLITLLGIGIFSKTLQYHIKYFGEVESFKAFLVETIRNDHPSQEWIGKVDAKYREYAQEGFYFYKIFGSMRYMVGNQK